ncbi:hypothetical protein [Vibrio fluminensis]|uniref:hypothetical protein n=1 Tax=Vibrio fluminensis TaxID=2783614 RepID=UPI001888D083|nr:hypothetical protein [Vibrio fluminensis]
MKDKYLSIIKSGTKTDKQLISLYDKLRTAKDTFSDDELTELTRAIEQQLRDRFPRAANRIFGAKDKEVIALLEQVLTQCELDLSGNKLGSHVKTGGGRLRGDVYLQTYISYKNTQGQKAELCLEQESFDSELMALVYDKPSKEADRQVTQFNFGQFEQAKQAYLNLLLQYAN